MIFIYQYDSQNRFFIVILYDLFLGRCGEYIILKMSII
jgi:hypothetical protein